MLLQWVACVNTRNNILTLKTTKVKYYAFIDCGCVVNILDLLIEHMSAIAQVKGKLDKANLVVVKNNSKCSNSPLI